jgi:hypothetical protein
LIFTMKLIGLDHPLDGINNPKYKLMHFLTTKLFLLREEVTNWDMCCHLALCL